MKKSHYCFIIISVIVLLLLSAACVYAADSKSPKAPVISEEPVPVTRQEFFAYMAEWLGLTPLDSCPKSFPDLDKLADGYKGLVFAMIGKEYVIGTTVGMQLLVVDAVSHKKHIVGKVGGKLGQVGSVLLD